MNVLRLFGWFRKTTMLAILLCLAVFPARAEQSKCGAASFEVITENRGHPLDNRYKLFVHDAKASTKKSLYVSDEGGWFYAACVEGKNNGYFLLFQSFCGGTACVEDKYGVVDTEKLKLLLSPNVRNIGNAKAASKLLGKPVPYLPKYVGTFCCGK